MSRVLTALRQLNLIAPAMPEVRPARVKPRLSAFVRRTVLAGMNHAPSPEMEDETSAAPTVLFQVPRISIPMLLEQPIMASQPQKPARTNKAPESAPPPTFVPTEEKLEKSLDQITAGLLNAIALHSATDVPTSLPAEPARVISRDLPRTPATKFELALRAKHFDIDEENAFRELAATMRQATKSISLPLLALASLGEQPESQTALVRLAMRMAEESGRPTLLIDAAFSTATLSIALEREQCQGLSDVLSGKSKFRDCLQATSIPNLDFLAVGQMYDNASTFALHSSDFAAQLRELEDRYAVIMCDVGGLSHPWSVTVAKAADAAYLAVELGATPMEDAMECIAHFRESGGEFRGCVVLGSE